MDNRMRLRASIIGVVNNQLKDNNPPETKVTLKRLLDEGFTEKKAKELIACVVTAEMFDTMKNHKPFDHQRYVAALNKLPELP